MHVFLADRSPPIEGPVAAKVRRDFCAFVAERASKAERHRSVEAGLVERSRQAIAQSVALLATFPDLPDASVPSEGSVRSLRDPEAVPNALSPWQSLLAQGSDDRYFFDIDDGGLTRRDAVGMTVPRREDIPRETRAILFDLAYAKIPTGQSRVFTAEVRDAAGRVIYRGTITINPLAAG